MAVFYVPNLPGKGSIYHIRSYLYILDFPFVYLCEISNPKPSFGPEACFDARCFRPLTKEEISKRISVDAPTDKGHVRDKELV